MTNGVFMGINILVFTNFFSEGVSYYDDNRCNYGRVTFCIYVNKKVSFYKLSFRTV